MRHCYILSVFTRDGAGGNPLGVVTDVTGLDAAAMQAIAADLAFSETVFLDWTAPGMPRARIFTTVVEIPFAGHPLVGAGWVLGQMGPGTTRRVVCGIGEVPFRVEGNRAFIEVPLPREVEPVPVAPVAGLPPARRAWLVRLPLRYLLLEADSAGAVAGAHPDLGALAAAPWEGTLLFSRSGPAVKSRFFCPALGVPDEDPATGSAAVALAAALAYDGESAGTMTVDQGDEVGAPSRIEVVWGGGIVAVGGGVRRDEVRVLER
ncbi:MAG: PhzF family phenazine biosynthesis protein [Acidimicrobiia bacterium]|nr:PhzF family phenazine biosynthesis protein [Acidimicrobiia bacterium]